MYNLLLFHLLNSLINIVTNKIMSQQMINVDKVLDFQPFLHTIIATKGIFRLNEISHNQNITPDAVTFCFVQESIDDIVWIDELINIHGCPKSFGYTDDDLRRCCPVMIRKATNQEINWIFKSIDADKLQFEYGDLNDTNRRRISKYRKNLSFM